ncbi:type VI secretion system baseplate subunit TssG [Xenorhabdus sp. IM139775]|uniref:type VI secretion system baseplate subunit TssG n=1 Tax=Xenorhabdus sp. IM139775 TaxID=3025876 RepID=UPI0023584928|nr:type VI secretion system baseplate subunit TssG [Xenorhabdus sp. IM139775]MDC9593277.1 type VI secretion system baseplate subunit TssG [Xenorhabdus sp. IM139775]
MNTHPKQAISLHRLSRLPDDFWQQLTQAPWQFDLFQTLRRIDAQSGTYYRLGSAPLPKHDLLRLGQKASLIFAPSTIADVKPRENSKLYDMLIYSFGLFGPNGPLPLHMTEYAYARQYNYQDPTLSAFANLFHHRLILLFYRAWANTRPTVSLDRQDNQRFCHYLSCLVGMGLPAQQKPDTLHDHARYSLSGHLSRQGHSAEGLEKILSYYFKIPLKIVQNIPQWLNIEVHDQAQLKAGRHLPRLGQSAFLGIALYDIQHKFRIELGPLSMAEYEMFLPGESKSNQLGDWVYQYLGIEYAWDIRLIIHQSEVKGIRLSEPVKLGLSSWLGKIKPGKNTRPAHRGDLIYHR